MRLVDYPLCIQIYLCVLAFILGTVSGSFCNAWGWRIVHHEDIVKGRSHCAGCNHTLGPLDLIPIWSYVFLKGRCRYCKERISPRYLIAEIIGGMFFVTVLIAHGFSLETLRLLILGCLLLAASLVDIDIMEIPDGMMIAGGVIAFSRLLEGTGIAEILLGLIPAAALLVIVLIMDKIMKRETMGGGDIKLLAVLGLHFGIAGAVFIILAACIAGIVTAYATKKGRGTPFPFGPMLAAAAWIMSVVGTPLINAYLSLF